MADIDFGSFKPGEHREIAFDVPEEDRGAAQVSGAGFSLEGAAPNQARLTLRFTAGLVPEGTKAGTLSFGPNAATRSLTARVEHELRVPETEYLGASLVGASNPKVIAVVNRSDADAAVAVSGDFTVTPASVPAGVGPMNVTVTFAPTAVGERAGELTVRAAGRTATCALRGVGVEEGADEQAGDLGVESVQRSDDDGATRTTYKVHVPSASTRLHLGAAVEPFPALDGFGLRTADRGLLHADSHIGVNSSGGDVRLQAQSDDGRVLTISGGNSVFAAKGSSYLVGDGGVLVTTALDVEPRVGEDGLPAPDDMTTGSNAAAGVFAALDGIVAAASAARALKTTGWSEWETENIRGRAAIGAGAVSAGAGLTAAFLAGNSVAGAAGGDPLIPVPGVTVYGHAGVLLGTPGFGGFYSAAGLVLSSVFPIMIGMDAEILGIRSAGLTGNDVSIAGWKDVDVKAGAAFEATAKKSIDLTVSPKPGPSNFMQINDERGSMVVGDYALNFSDRGVLIGSRTKTGAVDVNKPHVKVDGDAITLAKKDGGATAKLEAKLFEAFAAPKGNGVVVTDKVSAITHESSKHWVKVKNNLVEARAGSAGNKMKIDASGMTFRGKKVNIG